MMEVPMNPVIPERRRRETEVIDVDALDDQDGAHASVFQRSVRRRLSERPDRGAGSSSNASAIIVLDSDDEQETPSGSGREAQGARFRFISPPPPPVQPRVVPPVPPIPRHLAGPGPIPTHLRNHPVLRPLDEEFPFEAELRAALRRASGRSSPVPAPAPRSHHQPVMGLGGGLIALNRQSAIADANRQRVEGERRHLPGIQGWTDLFRHVSRAAMSAAGYHFAEADDIPDLLDGPAWAEDPFDISQQSRWRPAAFRTGRSEPQYWQPTYTHLGKPASGFTFDFAPAEGNTSNSSSPPAIIVLDDDEAGPSASSSSSSHTAVEATSTLVCARCLEPLVLFTGHGDHSEEEIANKKVWALRCGHMLDGKCMDELMRPSPPSPMSTTLELPPEDVKGKGKARADPGVDTIAVEPSPSGKGKGKAKAEESSAVDRKGKGKAILLPEPQTETTPTAATPAPQPEDNSILSRLRPRYPRGVNAGTGAALLPLPLQQSSEIHPSPRGRRPPTAASTRMKGKGKGRARRPVVEAHFAWDCPVFGCGHAHESVCIGGVWKMHEDRGAIGVFV